MKHIFLLLVFLLTNMILLAQNTNNEATQIKQQMSAIRKNTNWGDAAAAKEANAKIEALAAKLTQALRKSSPTQQSNQQGSNQSPSDAKVKNEMQQKMDDYSSKLMNQMMKIVREGDEGKMDLAKPLREEIVQEYKEDENPTIKNNEWLESMPTLVINMSWPQIKLIIDQMTMFKGITTLIITCDTKGTPVDLQKILKNAAEYPLKELYIINFGSSVSVIPDQIGTFSKLAHVGLFNNNISQLPVSMAGLTGLETLYLDMNPVNSIIGKINPLKKLTELGLAKTKINADEISKISKLLPTCKILSE